MRFEVRPNGVVLMDGDMPLMYVCLSGPDQPDLEALAAHLNGCSDCSEYAAFSDISYTCDYQGDLAALLAATR